jgi:hypothetical protein
MACTPCPSPLDSGLLVKARNSGPYGSPRQGAGLPASPTVLLARPTGRPDGRIPGVVLRGLTSPRQWRTGDALEQGPGEPTPESQSGSFQIYRSRGVACSCQVPWAVKRLLPASWARENTHFAFILKAGPNWAILVTGGFGHLPRATKTKDPRSPGAVTVQMNSTQPQTSQSQGRRGISALLLDNRTSPQPRSFLTYAKPRATNSSSQTPSWISP